MDAEKNDTRVVMHLHPALAPFKACVLPLSKKLSEEASALYAELSEHFMVDYDEAGSIGKRYRRQDEIGTRSASPTTLSQRKTAVSPSATATPCSRKESR